MAVGTAAATRELSRLTPPTSTHLRALAAALPEPHVSALASWELDAVRAWLVRATADVSAELGRRALHAERVASEQPDVWLTKRETARLTHRSVSWLEHHPDAVPGRRQDRTRGQVLYNRRLVLEWLAQQAGVASHAA